MNGVPTGATSAPGELLSLGPNGLCHWRGAPRFGEQDLGISPGGALDRFSVQTGNLLLGNEPDAEALELVFPPEIRFLRPAYLVLAGAHFAARLEAEGARPRAVPHAAVVHAPAGARLLFGAKLRGFRGYLCLRPAPAGRPDPRLLERRRGGFMDCFSWPDGLGRVRLLDGPELSWLAAPEQLLGARWRVAPDSGDMGLRLQGPSLTAQQANMVSDAVADGTVQLTPAGPIVLLRHRQTVGGYPRVFNAISADVDLLAQFGPGHCLRFRRVTLAEAVAIERRKQQELERLRHRFGG